MKKVTSTLLAGVFTLAGLSSFAQDAKEIVKKHNEAVGGTANWSKITSLKKVGVTMMMGMEMPMTLTVLKGKGMRQEFSVMGSDNYVIITPTGGWSFIPAQGHKTPQPMPAEELKGIAGELDFQDKLMAADARKEKIELAGKEELDGKPVFKLKVTDAEQKNQVFYVDAATYYVAKIVQNVEVQGQATEVATSYSNYTKLPSGIVIAMKEDSGDAGTMTINKVEENTVKDESIFKP